MLITPAPLQAGDLVAIVSPSGVVDRAQVDAAAAALRQWGLRVQLGRHVAQSLTSFGVVVTAGDEHQRWADLEAAILDPQVKAILCSRGGYGMVHLLDKLQPELLRAHPKWVVGFSDISALHAALARAGVASIHASMTKELAEHGTDSAPSQALHSILTGTRSLSYGIAPHPLNRPGMARAVLRGGNLTVLSALQGTPCDVLLQPGTILFVEDVAEEIYRVERMLWQLRLAGVLPQLAGLVVGQFTRYHSQPHSQAVDTMSDSRQAMYRMIAHAVAPYSYPVAFGAPIGHYDQNMPMLEGAAATLQVTASGATLHQQL